jgi:hypothetical protein
VLKQKLDDLEKAVVIASVIDPNNWAVPLDVLRKPNSKLRMCIDDTKSNRFFERATMGQLFGRRA